MFLKKSTNLFLNVNLILYFINIKLICFVQIKKIVDINILYL